MNDSRPTDKPKILIVDDTPTNLSILEEILDEDYFISIAQSGTQALSITDKFVPDLILLDVNMPGIDGFETCRRLKSRKETCDIPVIFITARAEPEDVIQGFKEGGVDYITKPFNHNEVMVRVKNQGRRAFDLGHGRARQITQQPNGMTLPVFGIRKTRMNF